MISYLENIANINIAQREQEGVNVEPFRQRLESLQNDTAPDKAAGLLSLLDDLEAVPVSAEFPYEEPNDLPSIRALAPPRPELPAISLSDDDIRDKILGGWLGRAVGCKLGQPIEGTDLGHRKEQVRTHLERRGLWPITGYFDRGEPRRAIDPSIAPSFTGMTRDDDIDYVILNLLLLELGGKDWTHTHARQIWTRHLSYDFIYAAGKAAYANFCIDLMPPETARWGNPCRQSLGAMIRCDTWGWVSPGNPEMAAEMAYRDAVISQTTNGIYSGMFFAAMIAAAFVEKDISKLINIGLSQVPAGSRFAEAIRFTLDSWQQHEQWQPVIDAIYERYSDQYFNHSIINACIVLLGLLSGAGDFERTIIDTVICGFDADCTGATAGSIYGVIHGASTLPSRWIDPLNDSYEPHLAGLGIQRFSNLADRTSKLALC